MQKETIFSWSRFWTKGFLLALGLLLTTLPLMGMAWAAPLELQQTTGATTRPNQSGRLSCEGSGFAVLEMTGKLQIESVGGGNAYFNGALSVQARGEGYRIDRGAWTILFGWKGQVTARGNRFQAQLAGQAINFMASGRGHARIRGQGHCTVNGTMIELTAEFQEIEVQ